MRVSVLSRLQIGLFCSSALYFPGVKGLASRSAWHLDHDCSDGQETGTYLLGFGTYNPNFDQNTSTLEPFNECYVDTSPTALRGLGILYTCDVSTGEVSAAVYDDPECLEIRPYDRGNDACYSEYADDDGGDLCLDEEACSTMETCTDDEPSTISPNSFNIVAAQYSDEECNDPTGTESVVSGGDVSAPGFSDEGCFLAEIGGIDHNPIFPNMPFLSECLADGSAMIQNFGISDDTCSGPVYFEYHTHFVPNGSIGPDLRRTSVTENTCYQIGDFYYRPIACTLDAVDVEGSATTTPAATTPPSPTAAPDTPAPSEPSPAELTPEPSPADSPAPTGVSSSTETPVTTETPAPTEENSSRNVPDVLASTPAPAAVGEATLTPTSPTPSPAASASPRTSPSPTLSEAQPLLSGAGPTASPSGGRAEASTTGAAAQRVPGNGIGLVAGVLLSCLLAPVFS
ncbi:unnamed protein product [Scytosiphon promiscuus]